MRIGYTAPENENCELRNNLIVNADLDIVRYKEVVNEGNIIMKKDRDRPKGVKADLLPNKFDRNRAHLVIFNWDKTQTAEVTTNGFLESGEKFQLMDPKNLFAAPLFEGTCQAGKIRLPIKAEFAVFVLLKVR